MDKIRTVVRSVVREAFVERPYGIAYTGAIVEGASDRSKLIDVLENELRTRGLIHCLSWKSPEDYHMTICLGELPLHLKMRGDIDQDVTLHVTHIGLSKDAIAFKVTGYMSKNDVQHITMLFVDQPADSKEIKNWEPLRNPFEVLSVIREVPARKP